MNMSGDIRVRTDRHYKSLYNELRNLAVGDMHELFFMCACLGYLSGERKQLGRDGEDRFWSSTFSSDEYASFYAMMIQRSDMDFNAISDDKAVIRTMEEYANSGMEILLRDAMSDFVLSSNGDITLDPSLKKELPKALLAFLHERANG